MGIGETITVINKSGKVVSSSKHIVNVFKEAKSAYRERKAEIQAERDAAAKEHKKLRDDMKALQLDDDVRSRTSKHSRATHRSSKSRHHHSRPPMERGYTDSFFANDGESPRSPRARFEQDLANSASHAHAREMVRRNTEAYAVAAPAPHERATRSRSEPHIDMDLAYGDYIPPPLPAKQYDDGELRERASKLTRLLDEANCLQHSAVTTIENLQKNPDALAAVALTLAEISTMLGKMGPGVLLSFKSAFPAVVALLASPQFMIAAGVGVGVTVVALGGYKIIKKLQANKEEDRMLETPLQAAPPPLAIEDSYQGLDELEAPELGRIEIWRRGIADIQASSQGTSVDGEFITPGATKFFVAEGVLDEEDVKSRRSTRSRHKSHRTDSVHSDKTSRSAKTAKASKSSKSRKSSAAPSTTSRSQTVKGKREKEPSLMKQLFRSRSVAY